MSIKFLDWILPLKEDKEPYPVNFLQNIHQMYLLGCIWNWGPLIGPNLGLSRLKMLGKSLGLVSQ